MYHITMRIRCSTGLLQCAPKFQAISFLKKKKVFTYKQRHGAVGNNEKGICVLIEVETGE